MYSLKSLLISILSIILVGCGSYSSKYSPSDYFSSETQNHLQQQITNNSKNNELYDALAFINPPNKRHLALNIVNNVINNPRTSPASMVDAEMMLGMLLSKNGNPESAFNYLKSSANKGNAYSQYQMAFYYSGHTHNDLKLPRDDQAKFNYTKKSAENNFLPAQLNLTILYNTGKGVKADFTKWLYWLKRSCQNGSELACDGYYDVINKLNNKRLNK